MRASGFPESLRVAVPLHHAFMTVCMGANACLFPFFLCAAVWERDAENTRDSERVFGWLLGFTSLELVHYSLTVLPSEIPGSGCVTQTHSTYTHKQKKCTHTFIFYSRLIIVLHSCYVLSEVFKKWTALPKRERQTRSERERDYHRVFERNHCHVL